jgi:hypothetical protein
VETIDDLLGDVSPAVLGRHLAWIVDQSHAVPQVFPRRTLLADQAQILIDILDRRDHYSVVARALREPWTEVGGDDEEAVAIYAGRLARSTVGQPEFSPYVSLARSASRFAASVLGVRDTTGAGPGTGGAALAG